MFCTNCGASNKNSQDLCINCGESLRNSQIEDRLSRLRAINHTPPSKKSDFLHGKGPIGLDPGLCPKPTLVVIAEAFREYPEKYYSEGVKFIIAKTRRNLISA